MSIDAHIVELTDKHHTLEAEIEQEMERPFTDSLKISELKRQKLRIKEEIERLKAEEHDAA